jgi:hypothetical protein
LIPAFPKSIFTFPLLYSLGDKSVIKIGMH